MAALKAAIDKKTAMLCDAVVCCGVLWCAVVWCGVVRLSGKAGIRQKGIRTQSMVCKRLNTSSSRRIKTVHCVRTARNRFIGLWRKPSV